MPIKSLSLDGIFVVLNSWAGPQRAAFLSVEEIAGLMKRVDRVLVQVREIQPGVDAEAKASELGAALEDTDDRHDWTVRALWDGLNAPISRLYAQRPVPQPAIDRFLALRAKLLPAGLATVQRAYSDEAGAARRALEGLDEDDRVILRGIPVHGGGTLLDVAQEWGVFGAELEALERRRSVLQGGTSSRKLAYEAKLAGWQVIGKVLELLEDAEAPADVLTALRQPALDQIRNAERREAQRAATAKKSSEGGDDGGGESGEGDGAP